MFVVQHHCLVCDAMTDHIKGKCTVCVKRKHDQEFKDYSKSQEFKSLLERVRELEYAIHQLLTSDGSIK